MTCKQCELLSNEIKCKDTLLKVAESRFKDKAQTVMEMQKVINKQQEKLKQQAEEMQNVFQLINIGE